MRIDLIRICIPRVAYRQGISTTNYRSVCDSENHLRSQEAIPVQPEVHGHRLSQLRRRRPRWRRRCRPCCNPGMPCRVRWRRRGLQSDKTTDKLSLRQGVVCDYFSPEARPTGLWAVQGACSVCLSFRSRIALD